MRRAFVEERDFTGASLSESARVLRARVIRVDRWVGGPDATALVPPQLPAAIQQALKGRAGLPSPVPFQLFMAFGRSEIPQGTAH
jgi:hypothetical protein